MLWLTEEMLGGHYQRVDIPAMPELLTTACRNSERGSLLNRPSCSPPRQPNQSRD